MSWELESINYDDLRIDTIKQEVLNELSMLKSSPHSRHPLVIADIEYLERRININQPHRNFDYHGNALIHVNTDQDKHHQDLQRLVYGLPWKRLHHYHRVLKVREYVNTLPYPMTLAEDQIQNREHLIREISYGLSHSQFVKHKSSIEYDVDAMCITEISCISWSEKEGVYSINWNQ